MKTSTTLDLCSLSLERAQALLGHADSEQRRAFEADPVAHLQHLIDSLCDLSLQDPLTGLANRRHFFSVLERELDRVNRTGASALLLMLDIDHFKRVNDTYGHHVGDQVLQSVARTLARCVRPMDSLCRYGGEEFAMVLPACQGGMGWLVAERIRRAVEKTVVVVDPDTRLSVTASIGGAFAVQWVRTSPLLWLERSDQQLYRSKSGGRNRVSLELLPDITVSAEERNQLLDALQTPSCWGNLPDPSVGS